MNKDKLRQKRKFIFTRLIELGILPLEKELMSEEQKSIYNKIWNYDFSYWEEVKQQHGWASKPKKNEEDEFFARKRQRVREQLRKYDVLPEYGSPLNELQTQINDQIQANDFSYYDRLLSNIKTLDDDKTPIPKFKSSNLPKMVVHRLRLLQILPSVGIPLNQTQQEIMDDIHQNWENKTQNYFINKYLGLSTPEGRLLYRLYKSHQDYGFNFNLTIDDIIIPECCPLLGVKLLIDPKDKDEPHYYSADRIDSSKGLVKGNIQIMSVKANKMKNKATEIELLKFANNGLKILANV
jgi:hypothetical protein